MNNWLWKWETRLRRYAISNLMTIVVAGMAIVYVLSSFFGRSILGNIAYYIMLDREAILSGQIWRLVTFIFMPQAGGGMIGLLLSLYFYWMIGSTLENQWGTVKFNLFYLFGMLGAILSAMITGYASNTFLNMSLFLAFALLFPNFQVMLFFILPIKVKYIAYLDVALFLYSFITSGWSGRLTIIFSLLNLVLFFGGDMVNRSRDLYRRLKWKYQMRGKGGYR